MASTKHHYVPQAHLRRFTANAAGEIYVYRKGARKNPSLKQPKGQAFRPHLYSISKPDGSRDSSVEDTFLQGIDDLGAKACNSLIQGDPDAVGPDLALYLASLTLRNPQAIEITGRIGDVLMAEQYRRLYLYSDEFRQNLRARVSSDEEFERMMEAAHPDHATVRANREFSMGLQMELHKRVADQFLNGSLTVIEAEGDHEFILSDDPVFACIPRIDGVAPVGLGVPGVEVTLPISPKLCLLASPRGPAQTRQMAGDDRMVSEINLRSAFAAAERFFSSSSRPEWLNLVARFPERIRPLSVEAASDLFAFWSPLDHSLFSPLHS